VVITTGSAACGNQTYSRTHIKHIHTYVYRKCRSFAHPICLRNDGSSVGSTLIYTHTYTHIRAYALNLDSIGRTLIYTHTYVHIHTYICTHTRVYIKYRQYREHSYIHIHMYINTHTNVHIHVYTLNIGHTLYVNPTIAMHTDEMAMIARWTQVMIGLLIHVVCSTHCNTLQHTATHCNTLQHTATHCNTL